MQFSFHFRRVPQALLNYTLIPTWGPKFWTELRDLRFWSLSKGVIHRFGLLVLASILGLRRCFFVGFGLTGHNIIVGSKEA